MSYDLVRSLKVLPDKVVLVYAASNVSPRSYYREEIMQELCKEGRKAVIEEILFQYWGGNWQNRGTRNKYETAALYVRNNIPGYKWGEVSDCMINRWGEPMKHTYTHLRKQLLETYQSIGGVL